MRAEGSKKFSPGSEVPPVSSSAEDQRCTSVPPIVLSLCPAMGIAAWRLSVALINLRVLLSQLLQFFLPLLHLGIKRPFLGGLLDRQFQRIHDLAAGIGDIRRCM